jgi:hypothetical protein
MTVQRAIPHGAVIGQEITVFQYCFQIGYVAEQTIEPA